MSRLGALCRAYGAVGVVVAMLGTSACDPCPYCPKDAAAEGPKDAAVEGQLTFVAPGACVPSPGAKLRLNPIVNGLNRPLEVTAPKGDSRLFIAEQGGRVLVLKDGEVLSRPFVDLSSRVTTRNNEQGLLGLAFHPRFPEDPRLFVNYSEKGSGATVIAELRVDPAEPDWAQPNERRILRVEQPFGNHNAGGLAFGPKDGFLYIGMGAGGAGGDPKGSGQNPSTLLGSLLRVDVDSKQSAGYAIPAGNPTQALSSWGANPAPELWAMGLRNPWRFSFDPLNSDLYIGDVGQNAVEEIHWVSGGSRGGENYGWNVREGDACYTATESGCDLPRSTEPVYTAPARRPCNSITGGHVYRGACLPDLAGRYIFGDYCHDTILSFEIQDGVARGFRDLTGLLDPEGRLLSGVSSFGLDGFGELYVASHRNGVVYRLEPAR